MSQYDPNDGDQFVPVIATSSICFAIIVGRIVIRVARSPRKWHWDDTWTAVSLFALAGRATCIAWSAALANLDDTAENDPGRELSLELLLPARVFYAGFLWCTKLCLLSLYSRMFSSIPNCKKAARILQIVLYVTFVAILFPTLLECRPIQLFWNGDPAGATCSKGRANLITMAAFNLATDFALIVFPLPVLWKMQLDFKKKLQLSILFSIGFFTIFTTLIRLPLILQDGAQRTRSLWASIEIVCACFVANAAFYYGQIRDSIKNYNRRRSSAISDATQTEMSRRGTVVSQRRPTHDNIDFPPAPHLRRSGKDPDEESHYEHVESLASSGSIGLDKEIFL